MTAKKHNLHKSKDLEGRLHYEHVIEEKETSNKTKALLNDQECSSDLGIFV